METKLTVVDGGAGRQRVIEDSLTGRTVGRYVIEALIARGGMGAVYRAKDPALGRGVAIKVLRSDLKDDSSEQRLVRESKAMAQLAHPNVLTVYDVGRFEGQVFIAMELVLGGTLRAWLAAERRHASAIVERFVGAGRGLRAAHEVGLAHRDFKPDNVLLTADGGVRVADFGLVGSVDPEHAHQPSDQVRNSALDVALTQDGSFMGTPRYMAPEQHKGEHAGAAADQFAFGVALYEALYGEHPFPGETWNDLARAVAAGELRAAPAGSDVPVSLRRIVVRALRVDPLERWPSMTALLGALEGYLVRKPPAEPADPELRVQVAGLRRALEEASALSEAGQHAAALPRLREVAAAAVATKHAPLAADALFALGGVQNVLGDVRDVEVTLGRAVVEASRARDDLLATRIWNEILVALRNAGRHADVLLLRPATEAAFARCDDDPVTVGAYLMTLGLIYDARGEWPEALSLFERSVAAFEEAYGTASPHLGRALNNMAYTLQRLGRSDEARVVFERVSAVFAISLGPDHAWVAIPINNLGELWLDVGDRSQALALHERAYAHRSRVLPPEHPHIALSLHNLGLTWFELGRMPEARGHLERALAIRTKLGEENLDRAESLSALGAVVVREGRYDEGIAFHRRAFEIFAKHGAEHHPRTFALDNRMAAALVVIGRTEEARGRYDRVLAMATAAFGANHPQARRAAAGIH